MQVINQKGNANQKSRIRKELQDYFLRIQGLRVHSKRVLENLQDSVAKTHSSRIGKAALSHISGEIKNAH